MKKEIRFYGFNDWIEEEKEAIKNKCACSVMIKKLREGKQNKENINLEKCSCNLKHTTILGHCVICGAKI